MESHHRGPDQGSYSLNLGGPTVHPCCYANDVGKTEQARLERTETVGCQDDGFTKVQSAMFFLLFLSESPLEKEASQVFLALSYLTL
jgi:hypothetical protein